jgi:hypothetical protein
MFACAEGYSSLPGRSGSPRSCQRRVHTGRKTRYRLREVVPTARPHAFGASRIRFANTFWPIVNVFRIKGLAFPRCLHSTCTERSVRNREDTMEVDVLRPDRSIEQEHATDYWREKAECLEEWVCELLRKNQVLRTDLQREQSLHRQREEATIAFSLFSFHHSPSPSERPSFKAAANIRVDAAHASCPRKECAEVRKSIIRYAVMKDCDPEEST